jgi:hypothetical protein
VRKAQSGAQPEEARKLKEVKKQRKDPKLRNEGGEV